MEQQSKSRTQELKLGTMAGGTVTEGRGILSIIGVADTRVLTTNAIHVLFFSILIIGLWLSGRTFTFVLQ